MGLGRLGGLSCGRLGGRLCLVGLFSRVGLACLVIGVGDTPVVLLLPACVGRWGVVGAPACVGVACCRGSGAVRPGCLTCLGLLVCCWGLWVGVGGLVVNCIVDASILL